MGRILLYPQKRRFGEKTMILRVSNECKEMLSILKGIYPSFFMMNVALDWIKKHYVISDDGDFFRVKEKPPVSADEFSPERAKANLRVFEPDRSKYYKLRSSLAVNDNWMIQTIFSAFESGDLGYPDIEDAKTNPDIIL